MTPPHTPSKHIVIGGGSGFIGRALTDALRARGDRVTWISRTPGDERISWDALRADGLPNCDAVVNLAGQHILDLSRRWNDAYRDEVINSRIETTEALVAAINAQPNAPEVFVSTAGKCFYGTKEMNQGEAPIELDEYSEPQLQADGTKDFPAELVGAWERAAKGVDTTRVRHVRLRIGVVLGAIERKSWLTRFWRIGKSRGFLPIIRMPFCLGLGAIIGSGKQIFPWIHLDDMVGILLWVIDNPGLSGRYNAVAPYPVTNRVFTQAFAKRLRRPIVWSVPAWVVKRIVGVERSSILLRGQLVRPKRTMQDGYHFQFPNIDGAMDDLVKITF
ncbi:MAG: TIGR01777 family oxidoreductase [Litorimonas sp.]